MSVASEFKASASYGANNGDADGFKLARAYRKFRADNRPAVAALAKAREWVERGHPTYLREPATFGAAGDDGGRWSERPEANGLRFVGFADECAGRGIDHYGWFTYPGGDTGEVARGAVYQLPGRGGRVRFVAALRTGSGGRRGETWSDNGTDGAALVYLDRVYSEPAGDYYGNVRDYESAREAAHAADYMAKSYAEAECEYQEAWSAGQACAEAEAEAKADRETARRLIRELRELRGRLAGAEFPNACVALRGAIRTALSDMADARKKAAELRERFAPWARPSWADSYQASYGRDPFPNGNPSVDRLADAFAEGLGA